MYTVTCPQSGMSAVVACACHLVGHNAVEAGEHHERCQMNSLTSNLACPPEAGCCQVDHDHEAAAVCAQDHPMDCPDPGGCLLHQSNKAHYAAMVAHAEADHGPRDTWADQGLHQMLAVAQAMEPPDECPGGHCHKDIPGCNVCHPVIITAGVGTAVLRPVTT